MNLPLDARQRAMLLEMGVRVWLAPAPSPEARPASGVPGADASRMAPPMAQAVLPASSTSMPVAVITAQPLRTEPAPPASPALSPHTANSANAGNGWTVQPLQLLYPNADPAQTPDGLGAGWLVITEAIDPHEPWAVAAGQLFNAMLQALQLHRHPRVALCALVSSEADSGSAVAQAIAAQVAQFAPSVVLVMGRSAIRAALGSAQPLTKLRAQPLSIAGVPAVATFDAPLLLRNAAAKRTAWADLCRARALAGRSADTPMP